MTAKTIAPHGLWPSPITVDSVASAARAPSTPRVSPRSGRAFFAESTPDGRRTIVEVTAGGRRDVLPAPYSVANRVYEYGAGLFDVLPDDRIVFSNKDDAVCLLDPASRTVVGLLARSPVLRYGGFGASAAGPWVLAIEEDHANDAPRGVRDRVVAIHVGSGSVATVADAADFYYQPRFSPDGRRLSWLEWDHPDLPFDAARLCCADWRDGAAANVRLVAGRNRESVAEPRWGPDGSLFFAKEAGAFRQLFRMAPGGNGPTPIALAGLEEAEFGEIGLGEASRTLEPLSARALVASAVVRGVCRLVAVDLDTGAWRQLAGAETLCHITLDAMARLDDTSLLVVGSGIASPAAVHRLHVGRPELGRVVGAGSDGGFPDGLFARPEPLRVRAPGPPARDVHGFLWMPHNPGAAAPEGQLPPLVVVVHGGPTARAGCGLGLRTQFLTTRGYAVAALNGAGSTGYGRAYRDALWGRWGITDAADAAAVAAHLAGAGRVRAGAAGITGLSSGGYTTLQALTRHPGAFAGGLCAGGISAVERLAATTHKLESDYMPALALPGRGVGMGAAERARVYRERSALFSAAAVAAPLVLVHGGADSVVPVEQATLMAEALRARGADVRLVVVEGEEHRLSKPASARRWLDEEEKLWRRTLLGGAGRGSR